MIRQHASSADSSDLLTSGFVGRRDELVRCVQEGVECLVDAQLAHGHPIFSSGIEGEAHRLFMRTPDGRRSEYRVRADGAREVVRDDVS